MKKNIHHVRKNIADRKRRKITAPHKTKSPQSYGRREQADELQAFKEYRSPSSNKTPVWRVQAVAAALLLAGVFVSERSEASFAEKPRAWVSSQLQEEFPFASVTAWYSNKFGDPLQLVDSKDPANVPLALPVNGTVTEPFENHGRGIIMSADEGNQVKSVKQGTVIFAGNDNETEKTIIVQHEDGTNTIYGYLSSIDVHLYEHVDANETLGSLSESKEVFFAIEKDKQYLDPVEVIKVDEGS
ncbi:M23 family metallopeptidase [Halobacillus sp. Marseille-Q1614]|uniref:M23 family metallopeptidase n=1 Tax=Halobacillus sp. Marseille-Q1614 TaxID=2709134 RepID=UPI001570C7BF|nr:M23 family metallopeptidase [Halobacillus sp. Marseille-Q1614]